MNPILLSALLSITPIGELRAGLPAAFATGVNPWVALAVCVAANSLVTLFVFFFLEYIHKHFMHVGAYRSLFDRFMERTRKKTEKKVKKYGYLGLAIFVAIPFPLTGAYTGAAAAWFFGMDKWKAFWSITAGIAVAGIIVLAVLMTGSTAWNWVMA
jgi:uncharacterized membrane protein